MRAAVAWLAVLATLVPGAAARAIEEPVFEVVRTGADFDLRRYAPYLVAETEVDGAFAQAGNAAFRILFDYISGNNVARTDIAMTAPVAMAPAGATIPGAAPAATRRAGPGRYVVSFAMPAAYTLATLPAPRDARVRIREVPARLVAVRRYAGGWGEARYRREEATLLAAIATAGLTTAGEPEFARFNSPFALWFTRRNEIWVAIAEAGPVAGQ